MQTVYYSTSKGRKPVKEFINSLPVEFEARISAAISNEENKTGAPAGSIKEIRAVQGANLYRILYYSQYKNYNILLHGLTKKKLPPSKKEFEIAEKRKLEFEARICSGEIIL